MCVSRRYTRVISSLFTYDGAVEEKCNSKEDTDAQSENERPPAAPAQRAAVTGRTDERSEDQAQDGAEEPREAVVLLGKAWKKNKNHLNRSLDTGSFVIALKTAR